MTILGTDVRTRTATGVHLSIALCRVNRIICWYYFLSGHKAGGLKLFILYIVLYTTILFIDNALCTKQLILTILISTRTFEIIKLKTILKLLVRTFRVGLKIKFSGHVLVRPWKLERSIWWGYCRRVPFRLAYYFMKASHGESNWQINTRHDRNPLSFLTT